MFKDIIESEEEHEETETGECEDNCETCDSTCDIVYDKSVNKPVTFPKEGVEIWGQKPLRPREIMGRELWKLTTYLLRNDLYDSRHGASVDQVIRLLKLYTNRCK